uniref:Uncharacterized protein n=1 Tax=Emiliania huxleyi TaxID=2903 RepID=A0A7S3WQG2_EMIHU
MAIAHPEPAGSIVNAVFAVGWQIARGEGPGAQPVDARFFNHVRHLSERCNSVDDWQQLHTVLLSVAADGSRDKTPLYLLQLAGGGDDVGSAMQPRQRRSRALQPGVGRGSEEQRGRGSEEQRATRKRSQKPVDSAERQKRRGRLQQLLLGAAEAKPGEQKELTQRVLSDATAAETEARLEREEMAQELSVAMRKCLRAAARQIARAREEGAEEGARKAAQRHSEPEVAETSFVEDTLRSGQARATAVASGRARLSTDSDVSRVDDAVSSKDLTALAALLESPHEDVAVKAALAVGTLCARDEAMQLELAALNGLSRIAALLGAPFSERGVLDLTLVLKALCANQSHHPRLLEQFVQAEGPRLLITHVGSVSPGAGSSERQQATLEVIRSLSGHPPARTALVAAGVIPRLLRHLAPASPLTLASPAAAAIAAISCDPGCAEVLLKAQALPAMVQCLARGPAADAAVSSAAAIARMAALRPEAQQRARDAGAIDALLPLLDGGFSTNLPARAGAEAGAEAVCTLLRGSRLSATSLGQAGGLQTVAGIISQEDAPAKLTAAAIETISLAAGLDAFCRAEVVRLGVPSVLVTRVNDRSKRVASLAAATLGTLSALGDESLARSVSAAVATGGGLPRLVEQLGSDDWTVRSRAATLLDGAVMRADADTRRSLVEMGAIPKLVCILRGGPQAEGLEAALGAIEALSDGIPEAQDSAREHGVLPLLSPLLDRDATPADIRDNSLLALRALVDGNDQSVAAAREAGLAEGALSSLDDGGDSECALLVIHALTSLGFRELHTQIALVSGANHRAGDRGTRTGALKTAWARL